MQILVTGAAGFIGSHLTERLLAAGHRVVGLDNFDPFYDPAIKERNIAGLAGRSEFRLIRGDIADPRCVDHALKGADVCCHLAALAGVRPSIANPARYHHVNVDGTLALLNACRAAGVKRFIFASSSSVYGADSQTPFFETDRCDRPASPYAATKRIGEQYCRAYHHVYGMAVTALRFFTVYGPRQRPDMAIHTFARLIDADRPIPFFGDGQSSRDYTYVDDVIAGTVAAILRVESGFRLVNLGDARRVTLMNLVSALERALGKRATLDRQPMPLGDVATTFADISTAQRELDYQPRVLLEEGLQRFVRWMRANPA